MSKYAYTGESDTTVVNSVAPSTRLPAVTMARDTRPAIGDVTRVNERFSCAASRAAPAAASFACATAASASICSASSRDVAFCASSRCARWRYVRASSTSARGRAPAARRATSAWNGRGSIRKSRSPFATRAPSVNPTDSTYPPTCGRTATFSTASSRPVKSAQSLSSWVATTAVVTEGAGGATGALLASPAAQPARIVELAKIEAKRIPVLVFIGNFLLGWSYS